MTFIKKTFASSITAPAIIAGLAIAFAGCASVPTDTPRLSQLDGSLNAAAGDKYVAEYGQADLNKARASLMTARAALKAGHGDETIHQGNMAESYIALGVIHGRQERMKAETIACKLLLPLTTICC